MEVNSKAMSKKDLHGILDNMSAKDLDSLDCQKAGIEQIDRASLERIKSRTLSKCIKNSKKTNSTRFFRILSPLVAASLVICVGIGIAFSIGPVMNYMQSLKVPVGDGMITTRPGSTVTDEPALTDAKSTSKPVESGTEPPSVVVPESFLPVRDKTNLFLMNMRVEEETGYPDVYATLTPGVDERIEACVQYNEQVKDYGCYFQVGLKTRSKGTLSITVEGADQAKSSVSVWVKEPDSDEYVLCANSYEVKDYGSKKYDSEIIFFVTQNEFLNSYVESGSVNITFADNECGYVTEAAHFKYSYLHKHIVPPGGNESDAVDVCEVYVEKSASFPNVEGQLVTDEYIELFFADINEYTKGPNAIRILSQGELFTAAIALKEGMYLYEAVYLLNDTYLRNIADVSTLVYGSENAKTLLIHADCNYVITSIELVDKYNPPETSFDTTMDTVTEPLSP